MNKKILALLLALAMVLGLGACGSSGSAAAESAASAPASAEEAAPLSAQEPEAPAAEETEAPASAPEAAEAPTEEPAAEEPVEQLAETTVYIDIAASLEAVFVDVIIPAYKELQPNVTIEYNTGSSGKLLTGIEEAVGIGHDLFFSAGAAQVKTLDETDGLMVADSRVNLLSNQLCLVKGNDIEIAVTGWDNIAEAKSAAICGGSVPVGKYTRIALMNLGILEQSDSPADYTTEDIAAALGGMEIDEADDVEVAAAKAVEGSVEIATIYYSDYYNHQNDLTILAQDDGTLTGAITYPVCLVENAEADDAEKAAAADFLAFLQTDLCLEAYAQYCFVVTAEGS